MRLRSVFSIVLLLSSMVVVAVEGTAEKRPLSGLATMGSISDLRSGRFDAMKEARTHPGVYTGIVILTTWGMLEPERGTYDFSAIDRALEEIQRYNGEYPGRPVSGKLRIFPTMNSPEWLLKLAGGPVEVIEESGASREVGLYWTKEYRLAWRELQQHLAERYDSDPLIREVTVNSGAMHTAEPFVSILNKETLVNLRARGYNDHQFRETLESALADYAPWESTVVDFTFNVLRETDSGRQVPNMEFTLSLMEKFRARYGKRAVLANHGLQPQLKPAAIPIYEAFSRLGGPVAAQTISPQTLTDESIQLGLEHGVTLFELWDSREAGGHADFTQQDLERWSAMIDKKLRGQ